MNVLPASLRGSVAPLDHVTWPITPYQDESLPGYVARTCHHNGLWSTKTLTEDAGIRSSKGVGHLPRLSSGLGSLPTLLAVEETWLETRRHLGDRGQRVNFHGAALRRVHFDYSTVSVVPTAMHERGYHREIWLISTISACSNTGELLASSCPHADCGQPINWLNSKGVAQCANQACDTWSLGCPVESVPDETRAGLALASNLVAPSAAANATAVVALPVALQKENRGDLFDLGWVLGCLDNDDGPRAVMSPKYLSALERAKTLARGAIRMTTWPDCLINLFGDCARQKEPGKAIMHSLKTIQTVVRKRATFGRVASILDEELPGITTGAFSAVIGKRIGLLTATEFSRVACLKTSQMAEVQRAGFFPRILLSGGERDIALFSPNDAQDTRNRVKGRVAAQSFASMTGLGIDAIEMLVADRRLHVHDDALVQLLWPEAHLEPSTANALRESLCAVISHDAPPPGAVELSVALRGCATGEKPWPAIVNAVLARKIRLYYKGGRALDVRGCLVSPMDAKKIQGLRVSGRPDNVRSEWLCEADAREKLAVTGACLRALVDHGKLSSSGAFSGMTYLRCELDAHCAEYVSSLELRAKLGLGRRDLNATLQAVGLQADAHGFVHRGEARAKLGLSSV